jgi:hypothetical protein
MAIFPIGLAMKKTTQVRPKVKESRESMTRMGEFFLLQSRLLGLASEEDAPTHLN